MSDKSKIEWTDATWNPVRGCTKVSPGCAHCYAETFAERFRGVPGHPYEQGFDLRLVPEKLAEPLGWKKPLRVFVNSMSDLFHEDVPRRFILEVFAVMACADRHTFQVLTKRPERMAEITSGMIEPDGKPPLPLENVWLGTSVENQKFADERIPHLLRCPAAVRFLSCEPLLGPLDLTSIRELRAEGFMRPLDGRFNKLDWVIVGGESGHGARPCDIAWIRSIITQCRAAGVPCFVKQLGSNPAMTLGGQNTHNGMRTWAKGAVWKIRDRKGGDPAEWPEDLRVREFPQIAATHPANSRD